MNGSKEIEKGLALIIVVLSGVQFLAILLGFSTSLLVIVMGLVIWLMVFILCLALEVKFHFVPLYSGIVLAWFMMSWLEMPSPEMHWFVIGTTFLSISSGTVGVYTILANIKQITG